MNNHPTGMQEASLNKQQVKIRMEEKNFFAASILAILRMMPWYDNEKERNNKRQKLKMNRNKKGKRI